MCVCVCLQLTCSVKQKPGTSYLLQEVRARKTPRAYQQRVREIEHSSFTPLILSATGGMGTEATKFDKHLASMLAQKWDFPYSSTLCWLRCRLTFSLPRSAIQAIRGARSSQGHAARSPTTIDLVNAESHIVANQ